MPSANTKRQDKTHSKLPKEVGTRAKFLGVLPRYLVMGMNWTTRAMRRNGK